MDEILSPITPSAKEDNEKILDFQTIEIESDKKNKIEIKIMKKVTKIIFEAKNKTSIETISYYSKQTIEEIKMNKYFLMFDNLEEIYDEILNLMKNNKVCLTEENSRLIINIPLSNTKIKEIKIVLNKKEKSDKDKIDDLYLIIDNMKSYYNKKIDELTNINQQQNNKINELNDKIENLKEIINEIKDSKNQPKIENAKTIFNDSLILNKNNDYISNLNKWINQREGQFKTQLLFRKSINGNSFNDFHRLCDNQGKTLVLIQTVNNLIIGGYTSKDWDTSDKWYKDDKSFLFSLTNGKIFPIKKNCNAIFAMKDLGPWFACIGLGDTERKNLTQGKFYYFENENRQSYENFNEIIPNDKKDTYFDVKEVEIYKIFE